MDSHVNMKYLFSLPPRIQPLGGRGDRWASPFRRSPRDTSRYHALEVEVPLKRIKCITNIINAKTVYSSIWHLNALS